MLKTRSKSGMASLRYTMLAVIGAITLGVGTTYAYTTTEYNNSAIITFEANEQFTFGEQTQEVKNNFTFEYNGYNVFAISYPSTDIGASLFFQNGIPTEIATSKISNGFYSNQAFNFKYVCTINTGDTTAIYQKCYIPSQTNFPNQTNYDTERSTFITENKTQTVKNYIFISNQNTQNINFNAGTLCTILTNDKTVCFQLRQGIYTRGNEDTGANFTENFCRGYKYNGVYKSSQELYSRGCQYTIPTFNDFEYYSESIDNESPFNGGGEEIPQPTGYDPETGLPCATIDTLIKYETNFNTGMCYSSTYIYSGGQIETITPKTFTELRTGYNQFRNDLNKYRNYCTPPATSTACANAFQNEDEKRSLINSIPEERLTDGGKTLYDYCHMYLTYSGDTNICDIPDEEIRSATYENLINRLNEITVTQPGSGSVYDNYKNENNRDILTAIPSVYSKITGIFKNNTGVQGIIPGYITRIIVITVLFVLFKK